MNILTRVYREPAALLGVVTATLGILTLLEVFDPELAGAIFTLVGAAIALLRYVVVPASEVIAQRRPDGDVVAGPAGTEPSGAPVYVDLTPRAGPNVL